MSSDNNQTVTTNNYDPIQLLRKNIELKYELEYHKNKLIELKNHIIEQDILIEVKEEFLQKLLKLNIEQLSHV